MNSMQIIPNVHERMFNKSVVIIVYKNVFSVVFYCEKIVHFDNVKNYVFVIMFKTSSAVSCMTHSRVS